MKSKQKFKRGNVVKVLVGRIFSMPGKEPKEMFPEQVGKEAMSIIKEEKQEKYNIKKIYETFKEALRSHLLILWIAIPK